MVQTAEIQIAPNTLQGLTIDNLDKAGTPFENTYPVTYSQADLELMISGDVIDGVLIKGSSTDERITFTSTGFNTVQKTISELQDLEGNNTPLILTPSDEVSVLSDGTNSYAIKDATARADLSSKVPNTRTVNGKALSSDITLTASDVGAPNDADVVKTSGNQSIGGDKTFSNQIKATLASYSATNTSSNASPYKKIGSCVLTGTHQTVVIPFVYSRTSVSVTDSTYFGKISLRTDGTAGTLGATTSGIALETYPVFVQGGDFKFYLCYKNNYPESNQVTCEIWVYVGGTYSGINIMPMRVGSGGNGYSTSTMTWGNNLVESATLPDGYTSKIHTITDVYAKTQTSSDNSNKIATTAFVKNQGYLTATESKSGDGYVKFSNGIIIQWGHLTGNTTNVTLPTAFTTTNYRISVVPTPGNGSSTYRAVVDGYSRTTTAFDIGRSDSFGLDWIAIGW